MKTFNIKVVEEVVYWVEVSADTEQEAIENVMDNNHDEVLKNTQETVSIDVLEVEEV